MSADRAIRLLRPRLEREATAAFLDFPARESFRILIEEDNMQFWRGEAALICLAKNNKVMLASCFFVQI